MVLAGVVVGNGLAFPFLDDSTAEIVLLVLDVDVVGGP